MSATCQYVSDMNNVYCIACYEPLRLTWLERQFPEWEVTGSIQLFGGSFCLEKYNLLLFPHLAKVYKFVPS